MNNAQTLFGQRIGLDQPLFLIAGPCAVENENLALSVAATLRGIADRLGILLVYKSSFDKANRSSSASFRGVGMHEGLRILEKVRAETGLPILTDVHDAAQVSIVADVVDMLQTPAFLARQTDLIEAVGASGKPANIKKAQFMAPEDMKNVLDKARSAAAAAGHFGNVFTACERGTCFGYGNLVVDMRGLVIMRNMGSPVVFDATHSVQLPGANGTTSGGQREFVPPLARAAIAVGISGLFLETHPDPDTALSDGPNAFPLSELERFICDLLNLRQSCSG